MSAEDYPCEDCGAAVGEPCRDDCGGGYEAQEASTYEQWAAAQVDPLPPCERDVEESIAMIAAATHLLPFGGLVGIRGTGAPDRQDYTVEGYLSKLADWITEYREVVRREVDHLEGQSVKMIGMQIERDTVDAMIRRALAGAAS